MPKPTQSLIPAIYPVLKDSFRLSYAQIGLITFVFQMTGSILQPFIGYYTDRRPKPYSLAVGMGVTLTGLVLLSQAGNYPMILFAAGLVGMGSAAHATAMATATRLRRCLRRFAAQCSSIMSIRARSGAPARTGA